MYCKHFAEKYPFVECAYFDSNPYDSSDISLTNKESGATCAKLSEKLLKPLFAVIKGYFQVFTKKCSFQDSRGEQMAIQKGVT